MKKLNRKGQDGGGGTFTTVIVIVILLIAAGVTIYIFTTNSGSAHKWVQNVQKCEGMGGTCVSASEVEAKRDTGYTCLPTCGDDSPTPYCCYNPFGNYA
jgi:flagellar basal body-associated protein FliL